MTFKVFVTRQLPGSAMQWLADQSDIELDSWAQQGQPSVDELARRAAACDGLLCCLTDAINRELLDACPRLKVISSMSVGVDHVDVPALDERNIPLGYTPGVLVETTADLTWALLMAAARRIPEADRFVREGLWTYERRWEPDMLLGKDIAGATLGIVGLGEIGQAVVRRAKGFGMRVLAWTRSGRSVEGVDSVAFDTLLAESDFLSVNVALNAETRNLIDAKALAKMKPGAVLVNTARGGIVDEGALAEALQSGQLMAAGIDVFESEPVAMDNPLLKLPNVVVAPHIGSASIATRHKMALLSAENLVAGLRGEPMPHCFNSRLSI